MKDLPKVLAKKIKSRGHPHFTIIHSEKLPTAVALMNEILTQVLVDHNVVNYPDLLWLKNDDQAKYKVEDLVEVNKHLQTASYFPGPKFLVVENSQLLPNLLLNKLLKMLEDPAKDQLIFFLHIGSRPMLPTISSRAVSIDIDQLLSPQSPINDPIKKNIEEWLNEYTKGDLPLSELIGNMQSDVYVDELVGLVAHKVEHSTDSKIVENMIKALKDLPTSKAFYQSYAHKCLPFIAIWHKLSNNALHHE